MLPHQEPWQDLSPLKPPAFLHPQKPGPLYERKATNTSSRGYPCPPVVSFVPLNTSHESLGLLFMFGDAHGLSLHWPGCWDRPLYRPRCLTPAAHQVVQASMSAPPPSAGITRLPPLAPPLLVVTACFPYLVFN